MVASYAQKSHLKNNAQTAARRSAACAETVFVIIVVKQIFDCSEKAKPQRVSIRRNLVAGGNVGFSCALKAIKARRKNRVAENRRKIRTCREQI